MQRDAMRLFLDQKARMGGGAVMGGGNARHAIEGTLHKHILSTGLAAHPSDSDGVPFDMISRTTPTGGVEQTFLGQLLKGGADPNTAIRNALSQPQ